MPSASHHRLCVSAALIAHISGFKIANSLHAKNVMVFQRWRGL